MIIKKKKENKEYLILGIDPSLNGTGIVIMKNYKVIDFYFFSQVIKTVNNSNGHGILNKETGMARLNAIYEFFSDLLKKYDFDYAGIEDYSYGSKSNSTFQIGGIGELLRLLLFRNFIPFRDLEPSKVKKFATGHGNAEKSEMVLQAYKDGFDVSKYGKNGEDLADAYWIAKMVSTELILKADYKYINSLDKNRASTFTDISKAYPIPLAKRPFITNRRKENV